MRYEAGHFPGWENAKVYHAEMCCMLKHVRWVDTGTHQYCQYVDASWPANLEVHQARRIVYYQDKNLFIINPIADDIDEQTKTQEPAAPPRKAPVPA